MNLPRIPRFLRMAWRCAFFSTITAPGIFLFTLLCMLAVAGSPSAQMLDAARAITRQAPAGSVMMCIPSPAQVTGTDTPSPSAVAPACTETAVDVAVWAKGVDRLLWQCYLALVFLAAGLWLLIELPWRATKISTQGVKC